MEMPLKVFVRLDSDDEDGLDPTVVKEKTDDMYYRVSDLAEDKALENMTVKIAEYKFVRMLEVKRSTMTTTIVEPI